MFETICLITVAILSYALGKRRKIQARSFRDLERVLTPSSWENFRLFIEQLYGENYAEGYMDGLKRKEPQYLLTTEQENERTSLCQSTSRAN